MIGPEALAVGIPGVSPNGGKEIYVDSTAVRSAYERGGLDPASYATDITPQGPAAAAPEALPQELIDAMRNGQPPPAHVMPTLTQPPRPLPSPFSPPPAPVPLSGAVEMMIPVGGGVTARVMFVGGVPSSRQWLKLIRHLQIEAEEDPSDEQFDKAIRETFYPGVGTDVPAAPDKPPRIRRTRRPRPIADAGDDANS
jgi:hypothetical protein